LFAKKNHILWGPMRSTKRHKLRSAIFRLKILKSCQTDPSPKG